MMKSSSSLVLVLVLESFLLAACAPFEQDPLGASRTLEEYEAHRDSKDDGRPHFYCYPYLQKDEQITFFFGLRKTFYAPELPELRKNACTPHPFVPSCLRVRNPEGGHRG